MSCLVVASLHCNYSVEDVPVFIDINSKSSSVGSILGLVIYIQGRTSQGVMPVFLAKPILQLDISMHDYVKVLKPLLIAHNRKLAIGTCVHVALGMYAIAGLGA